MLLTKGQVYCFLISIVFLNNACLAKKDVYIPVLVPMFGVDHDRFAYVTAMKYAFELINNRTDILPDYHLEAEYHDTIVSRYIVLYL